MLVRRRDVLCAPALIGAPPAGASPRARATLSELLAAQKTPGICAAVWWNAQPVWSEALGLADVENGSAAAPPTRFRVGSLSKLLTAATAARLYEQGKLDLDAPVQRYAKFPEKTHEITPRQLLGHLGGIRHYSRNEYINRERRESIDEALKVFADSPLVHPPRTKYLYSSYGYNLLGAVLEGASGVSFFDCVHKEVLAPLGMRSTVLDRNELIVKGRSRFYSLDAQGQLLNSPYTDNSDRWPSGGFLSTAEDLARFGAAHLGDGFLQRGTRKLIFTSQRTADGKETGVAFGWRIGANAGRTIYHHGGDSLGGRAFLLLLPEKCISVAIACNLTFARIAEPETLRIADLFAR